MDCPKCGEELVDLPFSSEPEGLRSDRFCLECNTRFGCTKALLYIISEPCDTSAIAKENRELKITIKTILKLND